MKKRPRVEAEESDGLPRWWRDSRREVDRLRECDRRRRDRQDEFRRLLRDWESDERKWERRKVQDREDRVRRNSELARQDGIDGFFVTSGFTTEEREEERRWDREDEEKEREEIEKSLKIKINEIKFIENQIQNLL